MKIVAAEKILRANDQIAAENRSKFETAGVFCVNLVGSPGAGKTTFLEALFAELKGRFALAVVEGDIAGSIDAERIEKLGVPVVQINTQGACHLDAGTIAAAVDNFDLAHVDLLFVENVGNLVCTAGFDLGEHTRIVVLSVAEGDDKVVKYPAIFQGSNAVVITKTDLQPYMNFNSQRVSDDVRRLVSGPDIFEVCAPRGDGITAVADWLLRKNGEVRAAMVQGRDPE